MLIENNPKEIAAMKEFHKGNRAEGLRLQEEFASEFREEYQDKDHYSQSAPGACSQLYEAASE